MCQAAKRANQLDKNGDNKNQNLIRHCMLNNEVNIIRFLIRPHQRKWWQVPVGGLVICHSAVFIFSSSLITCSLLFIQNIHSSYVLFIIHIFY